MTFRIFSWVAASYPCHPFGKLSIHPHRFCIRWFLPDARTHTHNHCLFFTLICAFFFKTLIAVWSHCLVIDLFHVFVLLIARISVHCTQYILIHGRMDLKFETMMHINFYEVNVFAPNYFRKTICCFLVWIPHFSVHGQGHLLICSWKCVHRWVLNYRHDQEDMAEPVTILCQWPL